LLTIISDKTLELMSSTESDSDDDNFFFEETLCEPGPSTSKLALDRCKVSDRDATHLLISPQKLGAKTGFTRNKSNKRF